MTRMIRSATDQRSELPPRKCSSCRDTAPIVAKIGQPGKPFFLCESCDRLIRAFHRWLSTSGGGQPHRANRTEVRPG